SQPWLRMRSGLRAEWLQSVRLCAPLTCASAGFGGPFLTWSALAPTRSASFIRWCAQQPAGVRGRPFSAASVKAIIEGPDNVMRISQLLFVLGSSLEGY